jgi:pimeloyl-ACP methyl ester carboxylesterase
MGSTERREAERMSEPATGFAPAAGADLYFERRGAGPPLLLIVGGGGDCGYYRRLGEILADEHTVLSYDRRGNSRSRLHGPPQPIGIAEQSNDAIAVLQANGFAAARIFGNSGGATIALDLAAHHPAVVEAAVCHEPPIPLVLPDAADYLAIYDEIERGLRDDGWESAFTMFLERIMGTPPPAVKTVIHPGPTFGPSPVRELLARVAGNWPYLTTYEIASFIHYRPDLDRIAANHTRIAFGRGAASRDPVVIGMCAVAAERLRAECVEFPGAHTGPMDVPVAFAAALRGLLARL